MHALGERLQEAKRSPSENIVRPGFTIGTQHAARCATVGMASTPTADPNAKGVYIKI